MIVDFMPFMQIQSTYTFWYPDLLKFLNVKLPVLWLKVPRNSLTKISFVRENLNGSIHAQLFQFQNQM